MEAGQARYSPIDRSTTDRLSREKALLVQLRKQAGLSVSSKTIKRALNTKGYTRCKACKKPFINRFVRQDCKVYAVIHLRKSIEFWQPHMYSDECSFDTSQRGKIWVTRLPGERYHEDCIEHSKHSGREGFMAWGAISYNWKSPLVFLQGTGKNGVRGIDYYE